MPIISDRLVKKPMILPSAIGPLGKTTGPKLIFKKDSEQNSFISNNNNSMIDDNLEKKPSNKIIFKQKSIGSNALKPIENRISPNSTLSQLKQNLNINSNLDSSSTNNFALNNNNNNNNIGLGASTQKGVLINKASLNSNNPNSTINSGKINFNSKINLTDFNNTNTETDKTNNTSFNTRNSSNKNNNLEAEIILNTSSSNINNNPNSIFKNINSSHLRSNSILSGDSANIILNNLTANGNSNKIKDLNYVSNSNYNDDNNVSNAAENFSNKNKLSSNNSTKDFLNTEAPNLNSDRGAVFKNFADSEKVLINNKISEVSNIRNNISLKKPAIMGAAYGNIGNSKPILRTKTEITKKPEENNLLKK